MPSVTLVSPYPSGPEYFWVRGNLHTHSPRSDGRLEVQEVIRRYAALRHDFLMMSDHDVPATYDGLDPCGMTLLHGNEISAGGQHLLDVGGRKRVRPGRRQQVIDEINAGGEGFVVLCHPDWESDFDHYPIRDMMALEGYVGVEIFNGGCVGAPGSAHGLNKWDQLLSSDRIVWGYANDDAHKAGQIGRGWNVALVTGRGEADILAALRGGACYASTGVAIESISCEGSVLSVAAPDAEAIAVVGQNGERLACEEAATLTFDAAGATSPYIRVDCYGRGDRRAWSQPILLKSDTIDRLRALRAERPVFPVTAVDRPPEMTGDLSDPLWRQAQAVGAFHSHPAAGEPAVATEARGLIAGGTLLLGLRCAEPLLDALKISGKPGDLQIWADDSIEIFIADSKSLGQYWHVMINAAGAAAALHQDGRFDLPGLAVAAGRDGAGWTLEVALPVAEAIPSGAARFNICRNRHPVRSNFSWSWTGRSYHKPECFGEIRLPKGE